MGKTSIEWTNETWNPVRGCDKVSPGCKRCYAETFAERWRGVPGHPYEQGFDLRLVPEKLDEPLRWKKPRRVFVNSMSDLFHEKVPDDYIAAVFGVMAACRWHTFQVLTKRAERMAEWFKRAGPEPRAWMHEAVKGVMGYENPRRPPVNEHRWPLPNVWVGVSVEDQQRADERIPHLLRVPAAVRFLSMEPLLGPVDLDTNAGGTRWMGGQRGCGGTHHGTGAPDCPRERHHHHDDRCRPGIGWVIVGGESGAGARPMQLEWARSIVAQCKAAAVPVFVKQLGARPDLYTLGGAAYAQKFKSKKGSDPSEWPADLRVREFPAEASRG